MSVMINVLKEDISYAEKILLNENCKFDPERIDFINNYTTLDLQAVPGSGKTTALLAKLLILEKRMPLENGSGVLVISHTNAAVDEIKAKIKKYAPKLFRYPNFVGTIQSFIDVFLAIPYYANRFKTMPLRIDNEIYDERIRQCLNHLWNYGFGINAEMMRKILYYKNVNESLFYQYRFQVENNDILLTKVLNGAKLEIVKPRGNTRFENYRDYSPEDKASLYNWFFNFKLNILEHKQILHFDDAYFLANLYIKEYPDIVKLLQKRFHYVYVDEMQDMDTHQHDILEKIFYNGGTSFSIFQRIGDINQAIYNGNSIHIEDIWSHRQNTLHLEGSHRINNQLAPIVEKYGLSNVHIEGRKRNDDGSEIVIKPHIFVFDDATKQTVIPQFAEIIRAFQAEGKIPENPENKFMAVAWRKNHTEDGKLGLSDYWSEFTETGSKSKIDYEVLKDYIFFFNREDKTLKSISDQIINAFLKILRLENILDDNQKTFSKNTLFKRLKDCNFILYEELKQNIYNWSISCINNKLEYVYQLIKAYIPAFLAMFGKTICDSSNFIEGESDNVNVASIKTFECTNIYKKDGIDIQVGTIHSAKGQTHTATLYLETFYERGYGNYESERLRNQFLGECLPETLGRITNCVDKIKQSAKMVYVGFSRPTHLLCFAIHKNRFDLVLSDIDRKLWEIKELF